jgi:hypothetical protein
VDVTVGVGEPALVGVLVVLTVTVVLAVAVPALLVAVNVYLVVVEGVTVTELPVTVPMPLSIEIVGDGEPATDQESVAGCPFVTTEGFALKEETVGAPVVALGKISTALKFQRSATGAVSLSVTVVPDWLVELV